MFFFSLSTIIILIIIIIVIAGAGAAAADKLHYVSGEKLNVMLGLNEILETNIVFY